ncbi:hypothetical protein HQ487_02805 [Candidatus Uhrbacteria bacterium]|nr:hypothetical protein [Candidatus Uhrbacteria bacterium]
MNEQPRWGPAPDRGNKAPERPPMGVRRENPRVRAAREAEESRVAQETKAPRAGGRVYDRAPQTAAPQPERSRADVEGNRFERSQPSPREQEATQEAQRQQAERAHKEAQIRDQALEIRSRIDQANQQAERLRQDGLRHEADSKEATVLALKRVQQELGKQLTDLAA